MKAELEECKKELRNLEARVQTLERLFRQWQREAGLSTADFNTFASIKHLEWKLAALAEETREGQRRNGVSQDKALPS